MTPEQIERLRAACRNADTQHKQDIRALLAEWEEQGREIERLKDQVELHREGHRRQWHARREAEENSQRDGARAEQAEARLAKVVEATLALISAVDAQIEPDKYMVGRLGQARANALAAAQPED